MKQATTFEDFIDALLKEVNMKESRLIHTLNIDYRTWKKRKAFPLSLSLSQLIIISEQLNIQLNELINFIINNVSHKT